MGITAIRLRVSMQGSEKRSSRLTAVPPTVKWNAILQAASDGVDTIEKVVCLFSSDGYVMRDALCSPFST